ncbi:MAG: DUF3179 domain-containing protein [Rhizobiaceae bacterium]
MYNENSVSNRISISIILLALLMAFGWINVAKSDPNPAPRENWKTDFSKTSIKFSEVMSGGPPKDGIPSIDDPKFVAIGEASQFSDREPVIGLEINGDARAYPLSVLMWHEIANDIVGGTAVTVTYCPLCNAAIVFDATIEGKRHTFGTTGRLRNSDLLMYDRVKESWWQQFSGEAVIGDYLGKLLRIVPSRLESFANFKKRFPNGKVLVPDNAGARNYGQNPYVSYDDNSNTPFLFRGSLPKNIAAMARVIVVRDVNGPIILSMKKLRDQGKMAINGFQFNWQEGQASALDVGDISKGREVGNVTVQRENKDIAYDVTFAFVAHAFHPEVKIRQ